MPSDEKVYVNFKSLASIIADLDMVCSGNVSVCIRVQDLCEQVQHRIVEVTKKSCEYKSKLEKYLILKELESSSANVNWFNDF